MNAGELKEPSERYSTEKLLYKNSVSCAVSHSPTCATYARIQRSGCGVVDGQALLGWSDANRVGDGYSRIYIYMVLQQTLWHIPSHLSVWQSKRRDVEGVGVGEGKGERRDSHLASFYSMHNNATVYPRFRRLQLRDDARPRHSRVRCHASTRRHELRQAVRPSTQKVCC